MLVYKALDIFFFVFHAIFTGFCTFGWIWKKTRKLNFILLFLTGISWLLVGPLCGYGIGYCPFTDWHWQAKIKLGYTDFPRSYVKFFFDSLTGLDLNAFAVDAAVAFLFAAAFMLSLILNIRDIVRTRRH
ncbi:MAG: DUF2784 family protein [Spirochaetales bacterium]|nr:DUF2784 family protein [Spirochaetales bacterium]